jgi:formate hydrogenlyase subunit 6/NADH:ubiquinone oxidoreductase subunit I
MKIRLYVYSGTGNSLWIARRLAMELKEATVQFMPSPSRDFEVEADGVGLVFPVHIWGLPAHVIQFINHLQINPEMYLFAVAVNAGQVAATLLQLQRLMLTRNLSLASGYSVALPSNYIPWGGPGPVEKQKQLFTDALEKVKAIAASILRGDRRTVERGPLWQNILFSSLYKLSFSRVCKLDKNFWVDDKCNRCGICLKVCPAGNIEMVNEKPTWLHRCEQCFACIQWCPQEAIQYGKKTPKYQRYHHPEVTLQDMLQQADVNQSVVSQR